MKRTKTFNRDFTLVVIGQIISLFGSSLLRFSLSLYVLDTTGRADIFATLIAVSTIPVILLSPIGGAIADRFNRRNLMVIFDLTSSAVVLLFALSSGNHLSVISIGVLMTLLAVISSIYQPTVQSSIPVLVDSENLVKANGIVSGVGALSNSMAPVLGGILYGFWGIETVIIGCCITFFLSAVMEIFIRIPFVKRPHEGGMVTTIIGDLRNGIGYIVKRNRFILKIMFLAMGLNIVLTPFFIIGIPYIVKITMESNSTMFGISEGIIEVSTILGALGVGFFSKNIKITDIYKWLMVIGIIAIPMAIAVSPQLLGLGYWPSYMLLFAGTIPIVMMVTMLSIYVITEVQKITPGEYLGKVLAIITAVAQCAAPIGQVVYGALFQTFSLKVYIPVIIVGIVTSGMALIARSALNKTEIQTITA